MIGRAPLASFIVFCRFEVKFDRELVLLGRLRKVLHALVLRHRSSSISFIVLRYVSSPLRRSSVSSGEEIVRVNHDFDGREAGGVAPDWKVRLLCKEVKSE